jgi:hypothetical protein
MNKALRAFRAVDFNWTHALQNIWSDPPFQVDELHKPLIDSLIEDFLRETTSLNSNPVGRVVLGEAGAGKTHLIGSLRRRVWEAHGWFVLIDIIGITDFWTTAALGFLNSLQQPITGSLTQYDAILSAIVKRIPLDRVTRETIAQWERNPEITRLDTVSLFLTLLRRIDPGKTRQHQDVVRALLLLGSDDWDASNLAYCWLQGLDVDEIKRRELGFLRAPPPHPELVRGMLWVMSLAGPTLIAVDQIDPIVSASNLLAGLHGEPDDDTQRKARAIIETLAGGLMALHDLKRRAMTIVSCLQVTWPIIKERAVESAVQRFEELPVLEPIKTSDLVEKLIAGRLEPAYMQAGFRPPYRAWPFQPEAIESAVGLLPRQILIRCQEHRQRCIAAGKVVECASLAEAAASAPAAAQTEALDDEFQRQLACADISDLLTKENEDGMTCQLLIQGCELFLKQLALPDAIDAVVKPDPDRKKPSLHARISFTFHNEGDREQHYCFRLLGHTNAIAFQSRLKAAMTASGIDTALKFRHLFILRRGDPPGGPTTRALVDQFLKAGGKFIAPGDNDLRILVVLQAMSQRDLPNFETWLRARKPLFNTKLFNAAGLCPPPFLLSPPPSEPGGTPPTTEAVVGNHTSVELIEPGHESNQVETVADRETIVTDGCDREATDNAKAASTGDKAGPASMIPIGRRFERGSLVDTVALAADLLPRHVAILAGSGSGKTVLLRRIVEEAALLRIPSIVLDINNDLSRLSDPWPVRPEGFSDEDAAKSAKYHAHSDIVIWTPGVSSGNPLSLNLLPDFAAIGDKQDKHTEDERAQAVEMARATLTPYLGGTGQKAFLRQGVLADSLRAFARRGGGSLDDLIGLLSDLPEEISKIGNASKLAGEIANQLLAVIATNPLLQSSGSSLDPHQLFCGKDNKTRISVISLAGLGSDEARQSFVNQLQMTLFTWIKQNPSPTGRLYVLDEAQNFAPSQAGTACKASARSLAAQARKYGLGMIFATQLPKGIDNAIVSNCTTHVYGRMSSPATIQAIQELMSAKGGAADDIARLTKGEFYFSTDGFNRPVKVRTPLCLSWHPPNPPTADEVIIKARSKRP